MVMAGCSNKAAQTGGDADTNLQAAQTAVGIGFKGSAPKPVSMLPKPTAFKMSGDYSNNVAITLNAGKIVYFPAPSDISENSKPTPLGDGWWLNRQGISANSVFTKYTFEEYSKLKQVPSIEELKASIIPGARVTEMKVINTSE